MPKGIQPLLTSAGYIMVLNRTLSRQTWTPSQPVPGICKYPTDQHTKATDRSSRAWRGTIVPRRYTERMERGGSRGRRQYKFHGERIALKLSLSPNEIPAYHFWGWVYLFLTYAGAIHGSRCRWYCAI
jgi:hypothetical protein